MAYTERNRQSRRLRGYDYARRGHYFFTINRKASGNLFGEIRNGIMGLNAAGGMVWEEWYALEERFPFGQLDAFIVMPDHVHGIIALHDQRPYLDPTLDDLPLRGTLPGSLGRVLQAFKSITTTRYIHGVKTFDWPPFEHRFWHRNYHDHIIRGGQLERIRHYIQTHPIRWRKSE